VPVGQWRNRGGRQVGPTHLNIFQMNFNHFQTLKLKTDAFPCSKNIQNFHEARFEHSEQLTKLGLQIPNKIHVTIFGTDSNLNLP
jgi:hypothetical protein